MGAGAGAGASRRGVYDYVAGRGEAGKEKPTMGKDIRNRAKKLVICLMLDIYTISFYVPVMVLH